MMMMMIMMMIAHSLLLLIKKQHYSNPALFACSTFHPISATTPNRYPIIATFNIFTINSLDYYNNHY